MSDTTDPRPAAGDPAPTWRRTWPISGPAEPGRLSIGLRMHAMPTDGFFAFAVPGYDAASTIVFPAEPARRNPIYRSDLSVLVTVDWRGGFDTSITVSWWRGESEPPPGAAITPIVAVPAADGDRIETFPTSSLEQPPREEVVRAEAVAVQVF